MENMSATRANFDVINNALLCSRRQFCRQSLLDEEDGRLAGEAEILLRPPRAAELSPQKEVRVSRAGEYDAAVHESPAFYRQAA